MACISGVPEETNVESCVKERHLVVQLIFLCGLLDTRA